MHDPTFEKLVARLRPDYGIHADYSSAPPLRYNNHSKSSCWKITSNPLPIW
nr:MAG TPA: hypothetical protein [Caudoviricetes sp.]